jgi:hypothetical protein
MEGDYPPPYILFMDIIVELKRCTACNECKHENEFYVRYNICKECIKNRTHKYYLNNKEKILEGRKEYNREYRKTHKEQIKESGRIYRKEHKEEINRNKRTRGYRDYQHEYAVKYTLNLKLKVYERLGNRCVKCGFSDIRALQIDHINGGGRKELENTSRYKYLKKLLNINQEELFSNYQILCANCNQIKMHESLSEHPKYKSTQIVIG